MQSNGMQISKVIFNFMCEYKGCVFLYLILLMAVPLNTIALPHYYGKFIENVKNKISIDNKTKYILYAILGLWILVIGMNYASNYLDSYFKPLLQGYVRKTIIDDIFEKFKESYKEQQVGDLISKIIKLPATINDLFHEVKDYIMPIILMFLFAIAYFSSIHPYIGAVAFVGVVIFFGIICIFLKVCIASANDADTYADKVHEQISEMFENMSNVYASNMCEGEMKRFEKYTGKMKGKYANTIKCSANFNLLFSISYLLLFFIICFMTFNLYRQGKVELTKLISVIIISLYIISYLAEATVEVRDFIFNLGTLQKTQGYLNRLSTLSVNISTQPINIRQGSISVRNVYMRYPETEKDLFENLNVEIEPGESVALVGRIGSGKSSFVKLLLKFYKIQRGEILIDGVNIENVSSDELRKQIMYIPQNIILFNRTLYENISYGLDVSKEDVEKLMRELGAFQLFNDFQLDDKVGKRGEKLSGGQKQMVYLLRSILKNSKIIILDEPTSALDENSKKYILDILKMLMRNKTVLIITHDASVLKYVDRVLRFHKGKTI